MANLPLLLSLAKDLTNLTTYTGDCGHGCRSHHIPSMKLITPLSRNQICGGNQQATQNITPTIGKEGFQACLDVQDFQPNELTVKTVDNCIVVEGNHCERLDEHGSISRNFIRRYVLPKGYNPDDTVSTLSSDGVLTVKVPPSKKSNERIIQIQHTGPAHVTVKPNPNENSKH